MPIQTARIKSRAASASGGWQIIKIFRVRSGSHPDQYPTKFRLCHHLWASTFPFVLFSIFTLAEAQTSAIVSLRRLSSIHHEWFVSKWYCDWSRWLHTRFVSIIWSPLYLYPCKFDSKIINPLTICVFINFLDALRKCCIRRNFRHLRSHTALLWYSIQDLGIYDREFYAARSGIR